MLKTTTVASTILQEVMYGDGEKDTIEVARRRNNNEHGIQQQLAENGTGDQKVSPLTAQGVIKIF